MVYLLIQIIFFKSKTCTSGNLNNCADCSTDTRKLTSNSTGDYCECLVGFYESDSYDCSQCNIDNCRDCSDFDLCLEVLINFFLWFFLQ